MRWLLPLPEEDILREAAATGRVLVVDDDADILRLLEIKLGKEGHEVTSATNGTAALAALDEQAPQLLVIENRRPRTDIM